VRTQFASGEPATVRVIVDSDAGVTAPRLTVELRDDGGLVLGAAATRTAELGWTAEPGVRELRLRLARLPLADGRFHLRLALTAAETDRPLHTLDDAVRFFVFPSGEETGSVLLDGTWSMEETGADAPIGQT
jgi:hypothetical protein